MDEDVELSPEAASFKDASPGLWQWLALRRIADSPCHGYELIRFFERLGWPGGPAASSLYPYLGKFLAEGYLTVSRRGRRKVYAITSSGEEHLRASAHPYFERLYELPRHQALDQLNPDFSEASAHVTAVIDVLKQRADAKELKNAARVLFRAAEALRRVTDQSA